MTFVGRGSTAVGGRLFETAVTFVGKGSSAVGGRSFETAGAELYCCWACGGLYELGCRRSLALVKEEGKASGAYAGGACADVACVGGAYADRAYVGGACWGVDAIGG